jgi:tRNA-2-methylthio-N6-dimethylallyladenosine synthase
MSLISKKVFIKTFGCAQNTADSERIKAFYWQKGYKETEDWKEANLAIINTCVIRESAENRVYGLINNIHRYNQKTNALSLRDTRLPEGQVSLKKGNSKKIKIVVTGCLAGLAHRNDKKLKELEKKFPMVSEFLPIEKIGLKIEPIRNKKNAALIPISFGCNNFCSYCIVPFAKGKEISRDFDEILREIDKAIENCFKEIVLIGQNVNSYGADLNPSKSPFDLKGDFYVSMGKKRFKSLFPKLLTEVAKKDLDKISFISSNPWDFSDDLIETIAKNKNIDRLIHLPFQAGDDEILKKMNRGYTSKEYLDLVKKIKIKVPDIRFSTDIIIGFPTEDEKAFQNTVKICEKVGFEIAYLNKYSPRSGTVSAKLYKDEITRAEKKRRWKILNDLVNKK